MTTPSTCSTLQRGHHESPPTPPPRKDRTPTDSIGSRQSSMYSERSLLNCSLPSNIDYEAMVWSHMTHTGGKISLAEAGNTRMYCIHRFCSKFSS